MKSAEITSICDATPNNSTASVISTEVKVTPVRRTDAEDPNIIKIAKLALILADDNLDSETKECCIMAGVRMGFLTKSDSAYLKMYLGDLKSFKEELASATSDDDDEE